VRTAVDSSVLLDVLAADERFGERSREALRQAYDAGALLACDVVLAEVRAQFVNDEAFDDGLAAIGLSYDPLQRETAKLAGRLWRESRRAASAPRDRLVADFLVGAHGLLQADALLTRDRGFYRRWFRGLRVLDPSAQA
jgi:predicted nucleic acid-binding protein